MNEIEPAIDIDKQQILTTFNNNVKGREIWVEGQNINHDGKEGHWLETNMGIKHNSKNEPDINGYEMKKYSNKITLGDFSASEYAFSKKGIALMILINGQMKIKLIELILLGHLETRIQLKTTDVLGLEAVFQYMVIGIPMGKCYQ